MLMRSLLPSRVFASLVCMWAKLLKSVCVCECVLTVVDILQLGWFVHVDIDAPRVDQDN